MKYLLFLSLFLSFQLQAQERQLALERSHEANSTAFETGVSLSWSVLSGVWIPGIEVSFGIIQQNNITSGIRMSYKHSAERIQNSGPATNAAIRQVQSVLYGGYIFRPERMWHVRTNLGVGALWEDQKNFTANDIMVTRKSNSYLLLDPRVGVEVNLKEWLCLNFWAGHSFTLPVLSSTDSQKGSPQLLVGLQLGSF